MTHGQSISIDEEDPHPYSRAYKGEALALADRVGISAAAREIGLQSSQLYQWRAKAQQQSASAREQALTDGMSVSNDSWPRNQKNLK